MAIAGLPGREAYALSQNKYSIFFALLYLFLYFSIRNKPNCYWDDKQANNKCKETDEQTDMIMMN
jgi:hypothetical protein